MIWVLLVIPLISAQPSNDSIFASQLNKCLKTIEFIPTNISAIFDSKIEKNHIELVIHNGGKFDYYELNWKGFGCYKATGLNEIPTRTEEEQEDCDNYNIGEEMDFYNFRCAYELVDDKTYFIMVIHSNEGEADVYTVNKQTGVIDYRNYSQLSSNLDLYVPHDDSDDTDQFLLQINECLDNRNKIPENLPISFDITKRDRHIEILAHYQNKYDFYKINWEGVYCRREIGEHQKPNETVEGDNRRCDNRPLSTHYDYGSFHCAYDIWTTVYDNDGYVVFFIERVTDGTSGSNAYIINKSTNKVVFYDFPDKFSGETIFQRYKELDATIALKECSNKKLQLPENLPMKFEILTSNRSIKIFLTYQNKTDYYEINWNGRIRSFEARLDDIPVKRLEELLPEDNGTEFNCPYSVLDDRDYSIIVIESKSTEQDDSPEAYVYFINKETFEVTHKFYPTYYQCILEVPQSKNDENPKFDREIESCANRKSLIPAALNASISRINNHIRITVNYGGKQDYYEINYKGATCHAIHGLIEPLNRTTEMAAQQCEKRRITPCTDTPHSFSCGIGILHPENDHYVALVIQSAFDPSSSFSAASVYLLDELTNEIDFRRYNDFTEDQILVNQTEMDKNSVYVAEFDECLNLQNAIPTDVPIKFNVTKVNHHINILVYDDGKYDYYEHNVRGEACFTAVREAMNPTRTHAEQMKCDARRLRGSLKPYTEEYQPQFRCGYEVIKNSTDVVIFIHSTDGVYEYNIDRGTGKTELYLYQVSKCLKRKYTSDTHIPLEVTTKPKDLDNNENYLEILVKYRGNYDLYVTDESGYVRYMEMQLRVKPNLTHSDYSNKIQCQQNTYFRVFHLKNFRCPLKVVKNANYVNISVNAFHYENVYVVDKSTNEMQYFKVKDNLILSNLPIPDAKLNYIADVDECMEKLLNLTSPFPVDVVRHKDFLQISVKFNGTFDIYETTSSGREMCKITRESSEKPPTAALKSLEDYYPECVSCDGPAFSFTCPSADIREDENQITFELSHGPGMMTHSYKLSKVSGEFNYEELAALGPPQFSNVLKSLIG